MPTTMPEVFLNPEVNHIDDFTFDDFAIVDYKSHPAIKAEVSV
jgi:thymidylate synthase